MSTANALVVTLDTLKKFNTFDQKLAFLQEKISEVQRAQGDPTALLIPAITNLSTLISLLTQTVHEERNILLNSLQDVGNVAAFPDVGGLYPVPSGPTAMNLVTGAVAINGVQEAPRLSDSLRNMGREKFRSAFIFNDQPSEIIVDQKTMWLPQGLNALQLDMRNGLTINSYMPQLISVVFSTGINPPVNPMSHSMDFRRFGTATSTDTMTPMPLLPIGTRYLKGPATGVPGLYYVLDSDLVVATEYGPSVANVKRKSIIVQNAGSSNAVTVNIQGNLVDNQSYADDDSTGAGVSIAASSFGVFDISKMYGRIRVRVQSTSAGNHTNVVATLLGVLGGGSG